LQQSYIFPVRPLYRYQGAGPTGVILGVIQISYDIGDAAWVAVECRVMLYGRDNALSAFLQAGHMQCISDKQGSLDKFFRSFP